MSGKSKEIIPSASRLMESMRSVGYGFENAVADILDNSIRAGATIITIEPKFSGSQSYFLIADNGKGMDEDELDEAMRFGSESDYGPSSLGKFGLGLKTSSLSQCSSFYVGSLSEREGSQICLLSWDFDHVKGTNKWEVLYPSVEDTYSQLCCKYLRETHGTVVLWKGLDNLFQGLQNSEGGHAQNLFVAKCRETEQHLAMVFHRFLTGEHGGDPIQITFSGNNIEPWNPFALDYGGKENTWKLQNESIEVSSTKPKISYEGFVLPSQKEFDSRKDFDNYAGPEKWNKQQGFYIYRAHRMIQSGGWSGIRTVDEHSKLARCALHFSPELDKMFRIDIGKMKTTLPPELKEKLKEFTKPLVASAKERYKRQGPPPPTPPPPQPRPRKYTLHEVREMLSRISDGEELPVVNRVFERLLGGD